jgi:hypothetical protein
LAADYASSSGHRFDRKINIFEFSARNALLYLPGIQDAVRKRDRHRADNVERAICSMLSLTFAAPIKRDLLY